MDLLGSGYFAPCYPGRTLAMLVLMSIHDLMKLDRLRPTCSVKQFNGYKKGEQILRFSMISAFNPANLRSTNWLWNWIFLSGYCNPGFPC